MSRDRRSASASGSGARPAACLVGEIGAGQEPADGREVVRGHRGERLARVAGRRHALEDDQPRRQQAPATELGADAGWHRAQILADDDRSGAVALDGHDLEQLVGGGSNVRSGVGRAAGRDPPQAKEPEHVVDPQPSGMPQLRPDGIDERPVAGLPEPMRDEGREPPLLACGGEAVGRRADRRAERERRLPVPRVEAAGIDADRHVGDAGHGRRGRRELPIEAPLDPGVECDAIGRLSRDPRRPRPVGVPQVGRPRLPAGSMTLGQDTESAPALERVALRPPPRLEGGTVRDAGAPDPPERLPLQRPDACAVDRAAVVERATRSRQLVVDRVASRAPRFAGEAGLPNRRVLG